MKTITKEVFIASIKAIENQLKIDEKCHKAFQTLLPHDYVTGYNNDTLMTSYINTLASLTNDTDGWIEYYIWETNFGKSDPKITIRGEIVPLKTPLDLWKIIQ